MNNRFKLKSMTIENNIIFKRSMNLDVLSIDFDDRDFIGLIGTNGCGKSTFINEMQPRAIYGLWIPGLIGKKIQIWENYKSIIELTFVFEPNGEKHSCKGYFVETIKSTGEEIDHNPNGYFDNTNKLVEEFFGVNSKTLNLFYLSHKAVFLAQLTASERLQFIQNAIPALSDYRKIALDMGEKKNFISKSLKTAEHRLSKLNAEDYIIDTIQDIDVRLKMKNEELRLLDEKIKYNNEIRKEMEDKEKEAEVIKRVNMKIESIISLLDINRDELKINEDTSLKSIYDKILNDIRFNDYDIQSIEKNISEIENQLSDTLLKETFNKSIDTTEFDKLDKYFKDFENEELTDIMKYDIDELSVLKNCLVYIKNLLERYNNAGVDIREILNTIELYQSDSMYQMKYKDMIIKDMKDIDNEIAIYQENLITNKVYKELKKNFTPSEESCSRCKLYKMVEDRSDKYDNIQDLIMSREKDREKLERRLKESSILFDMTDNFIRERDIFMKNNYSIKHYLGDDFEMIDYLLKPYLIDDGIEQLTQMQRDKQALILYKQMKTTMEYRKLMSNDTNSVTLKDRLSELNGKLEKLYVKRNELNKYRVSYATFYNRMSETSDSNLLYKRELDLINESMENKNRISYLSSEIELLKNDLKATDPAYRIELEELIKKEQEYRDKMQVDLISRRGLEKEIKDYQITLEEVEAIHMSISNSMVKKVIKNFMLELKDSSNKWLKIMELPYKIYDIIIDEKEFRISIITEENNSEIVNDISLLSAGECCTVGTILSFAAQRIINTNYDLVQLDEVDALLENENRKKFITMIMKFVSMEKRQVVAISHNGNFPMYNDIALISFRGGDNNASNPYLFKYNE